MFLNRDNEKEGKTAHGSLSTIMENALIIDECFSSENGRREEV
jgi:hypothetical protein